MNFIKNDMRVFELFLKEQLLNKNSIGHIDYPTILSSKCLHAYMIPNFIPQSAGQFSCDSISKSCCCNPSRLANCYFHLFIRLKDGLRNLGRLPASCLSTNDDNRMFLDLTKDIWKMLSDWK